VNAASPLATPPGWTLGVLVDAYAYREPEASVRLDGTKWGAAVGCTLPGLPGGCHLQAGLEASWGALGYRGSGSLERVPEVRLEPRILLGRDFAPAAWLGLSPFIGFGQRSAWNDLRGTTSTGARGYRRESRVRYLPVGCWLRVPVGPGRLLAGCLEWDPVLQARAISRFTDVGGGYQDAINHPGGGRGFRTCILFESGTCSVGPWLQEWRLDRSEWTPIGRGTRAQEPANRTREAGLLVQVRLP
jgi:hypothetical protein